MTEAQKEQAALMQGQEQDMRIETQIYLEGLAKDFMDDLSIENLLDIHTSKLDLIYLEARKFFIEYLAALDRK